MGGTTYNNGTSILAVSDHNTAELIEELLLRLPGNDKIE